MQSPKSYWNLDPTSTATPDNESIVAATAGGNWLLGNAVGAEPLISVLAFAGIDPTGAADSSAGIQAAFNALAGLGQVAWFPAGTYLLKDTVDLPNGLVMQAGPDVIFNCDLPVRGSPASPYVAAFSAEHFGSPYGTTTLSAAPALGATSISIASIAIGPAGANLVVGDGIALQDTITAHAANQAASYEVRAVAGGGPYTVTLIDRSFMPSRTARRSMASSAQ